MKKENKCFFVYYNGVYLATYKRLQSCINFIERKRLGNDCNDILRIVDSNGEEYNCYTGIKKYYV